MAKTTPRSTRPRRPTYSGVYIEEFAGSVPTIQGTPTSIAAFVGATLQGPVDQPVPVASFAEFERVFGGLWLPSRLGYAVRDFFDNGGKNTVVVRVNRSTAAVRKADFIGPAKQAANRGLYALNRADLFNLLCIPPYNRQGNVDVSVIAAAAKFCEERRAFFLIDPPRGWTSQDRAKKGIARLGTKSKNAAVFFPRLRALNPVNNQVEEFPPSGAVAGIYARTDAHRGVWKVPADEDAKLVGEPDLSVPLSNRDIGELSKLGINCLRKLPTRETVVWGSRTRQGDDQTTSDWKYIPVRRLALFIEESIVQGTQWAIFEPNDEPLWANLRFSVGAFLQQLFREGAFVGRMAAEGYFVRCDQTTMTQADINNGVVNILFGFAPLKPAEFVVLRIRIGVGQGDK